MLQQKIHLFESVDEFMNNHGKPHLSLDFLYLEKPADVFFSRLDRRIC